MRKKEQIGNIVKSILNSYAQVFFSDHKLFAVLLMLVTFIDYFAGISGLMSVVVTNIVAYSIGFNREQITKGYFGFNSLLVGLGIGLYFQPGWLVLFIIFLAAVLTLFLCISLQGIIGKYALPYLSIPFVLSLWVVSLATREFEALGVSERGIYTFNDLYIIGGNTLVSVYEWWNRLEVFHSVRIYLLSLGAIFFQYNVLAGILIALGLLYYSRIAFTLSLLGFYSAYLFYFLIGANISEMNYSYIGFNYILTSIAIGGFFLVPSRLTYVWTILIIPLVAILTISLGKIFAVFALPIYSLPFNIMVLLFLYMLKFRVYGKKRLHEVVIQHNSPEKNLYAFANHQQRFGLDVFVNVKLPFWGEWTVSQGHDGEYTHKEEWRHAWDFVIMDEDQKQYKGTGDSPEDYYCYGKNILAPADGTIETIVDGIDDNPVGQVNLRENWGNTIIIKHAEGLYAKLSHLKPGSINVKKGDSVKQGNVLATCGNSGRSPYPHLHFQFQATPYIGSKTLNYPFAYYIRKNPAGFELRTKTIPQKDEVLMNVETQEMIKNAFDFIPGKKLQFVVSRNGQEENEEWEVVTNIYNQSYMYCHTSQSIAWFKNDGQLFYFTHFEGNRDSLLYYFFLGAYKVQFGFYKDLQLSDQFPLNLVFSKRALFFHDFIAPFFFYKKGKFQLSYDEIDNDLAPEKITLKAQACQKVFGQVKRQYHITYRLNKTGIDTLDIQGNNIKITATCTKDISFYS